MERQEEVKVLAYRMWEDEGRPEGHALDYWLKAEDSWQHQQDLMLEHMQEDVESY